MMKLSKRVVPGFMAFYLAASLGFVGLAKADESSYHSSSRPHKHLIKRAFRLGVCVGETLDREGITVFSQESGQSHEWDESTRKAFRAALKECKQKMRSHHRGQQEPSESESSGSTTESMGEEDILE